jgi:hypothetical protein
MTMRFFVASLFRARRPGARRGDVRGGWRVRGFDDNCGMAEKRERTHIIYEHAHFSQLTLLPVAHAVEVRSSKFEVRSLT